ncbi:MAG TPA: hypothetical protein VL328_15035 [Gemmatimonadaceae bacterium]|jgi:hypothetical protein|nr:hypothetical protein [Gemmatimonadaceae bacterium]
MTRRSPRSAAGSILARLALGLVAAVLLLALAEGAASAYLFASDFRAAAGPNTVTRPHTTYDTLLGWVNRKSFVSPNEFGPGLTLTTDAQGFRDTRDVTPVAPAGEVRLVCSGDSFTLASGIADGLHWCAQLESRLPGLRTMNMGQGMYGLDQAYLWYARDGVPYAHDAQILAITDVMLERSTTGTYSGRNKPYFELDHGRLAARNVPVPRQTTEELRVVYAARAVEDLRLMQLIRRIPMFGGRRSVEEASTKSFPIFEKIFDDLRAIHARHGSRLIIVYLPTKRDMRPGLHDAWRRRIAGYAHGHGVPFFDLTPAMRKLRPDSLDLVWITRVPAGSPTGVPGHYTNLGHLWVARVLADSLATLPEFARLAPQEHGAR